MAATAQTRSGTTDLTVGKPLFQILRFALPLVLGTLFQQLYSFADTVIVGRCLGTDALGAVGTTYSLNFLILGFVQGACVGFGIPAAETFGAKDKDGLQKYLLNGALLCLVLSVVFTVLTTLMAGPRHTTGSVSCSSSRFRLITRIPVLVTTGMMPISVPCACSCRPKARGMEGPVISASRTAAV